MPSISTPSRPSIIWSGMPHSRYDAATPCRDEQERQWAVRFFDFDWAAPEGQGLYPLQMNLIDIKWPTDVGPKKPIFQRHDRIMLEFMRDDLMPAQRPSASLIASSTHGSATRAHMPAPARSLPFRLKSMRVSSHLMRCAL